MLNSQTDYFQYFRQWKSQENQVSTFKKIWVCDPNKYAVNHGAGCGIIMCAWIMCELTLDNLEIHM